MRRRNGGGEQAAALTSFGVPYESKEEQLLSSRTSETRRAKEKEREREGGEISMGGCLCVWAR